MGGKTVVADAQFGIARILRPYQGFEQVYGGQPAFRQIMLTEVINPPGGQALDESAGKTGYDPELVRGLAVPIGARVILWIPKIVSQGLTQVRYRWSLQWRLRNIFDYRLTRVGYHYPKQGVGAKDTTPPGPAKPRVVIPVANQTVIYNEEPQPAGVTDPVAGNMRIEDVTSGGDYPTGVGTNYRGLPINPDGVNGTIQQGILDPVSVFGMSGRAQAALYEIHEVQAVGDELIVGLWRDDPGSAPNWDFAGDDSPVSVFLGLGPQGVVPDVGVYVMCGSAP